MDALWWWISHDVRAKRKGSIIKYTVVDWLFFLSLDYMLQEDKHDQTVVIA